MPPPCKREAATPLGLRAPGGSYVPAYLDLVRRDLKRDYAEADLAAAGLSVYTSLDLRAQAAAERALTQNLQRLDSKSPVRGEHLEGAVIVVEPNSGDVVAVVGGREVGTNGFDRALDARRPIGSLVKPAVYLTALETGRYTAATLIEDAPIELKLADGSVWAPQNFERQVYGQVPLARALAESMNLATVRLGIGPGSAEGRRDARAARARIVADAQPVAPARRRGDVAARGGPGVHDTRERRLSHPAAGGARRAGRARPAAASPSRCGSRRRLRRPPSISSTACSCSCRLTAPPAGRRRGSRKVW